MKRIILFFVLTLFIVCGYSQNTYTPGLHTTSPKPYAPSLGVPTDARSYFYDVSLFKYRPYNGKNEVYTYLNTPNFRTGQFIIVVNETATLQSNGRYLDSTVTLYVFKNGTKNSDLVPYGESNGVLKYQSEDFSNATDCLVPFQNFEVFSNDLGRYLYSNEMEYISGGFRILIDNFNKDANDYTFFVHYKTGTGGSGENITVYSGYGQAVDTANYTSTPSTLQNSISISDSANITADFRDNVNPRYLIVAEPIDQPIKTTWYGASDNNGNIATSLPTSELFRTYTKGSWRIYISTVLTQNTQTTIQFRK